MDTTAFGDVLRRLDLIESRLADHEFRIAEVERSRRVQPVSLAEELNVRPRTVPPTPPPVQVQPKVVPPRVEPPRPPVAVAAEPSKPRARVDAEYQIGARVLPYAGALLFILGLAYLVSLGLGRGIITPAMLWWGANLLSLSFVLVGQIKRDEREQFGQILTAVGSCGFYLNFAAGHVFQNLYSGEMLVTLFVAHSLVNLGYAFWRSSRAFLALGLFGGLIAALMPLRDQSYTIHVMLQFLILAPATAIAAKNKWIDAAMWIYAAGTATMLPVAIDVRAANELRVAAILGTGVLTVAGYAWSYRRQKIDPYGLFAPAALFLNGLIGFLCFRNEAGAGALVLYGGAIAASAALMARDQEMKSRMLVAAVAIPAILAPYGFDGDVPIWVFLGIGVALATVSRKFGAASMSVLAAFELAQAANLYLLRIGSSKMPWTSEALMLLGTACALAIVTWSLVRAHRRTEPMVLGASMLTVPLVARLAHVVLGMPTIASPTALSVAVGLLAAAAAASVLALITKWDSARTLLWTTFAAAYLVLANVVLSQPPPPGVELWMLLGFAGVLLASARVSRRSEEIIVGACALAVPLTTRLVQVILSSVFEWPVVPAVAIGLALSTVCLAALVQRHRTDLSKTLFWGTYLVGYSVLALGIFTAPMSLGIELLVLAVYLGTLVLVGRVVKATISDYQIVFIAAAGVPLVTRTVQVLLGTPSFEWPILQGLALGLAIATAGLAYLASRNKTDEAGILLWLSLLTGYGLIVFAALDGRQILGIDLLVALAYLSVLFLAARSRIVNGVWGVATALGGLLIVRVADLLLTLPRVGFEHHSACVFGATAVAIVSAVVSWKGRFQDVSIASALFALGAVASYPLTLQEPLPYRQDLPTVGLLLAAVIASSVSLARNVKEKEPVYYGAAALVWLLSSQFGYLVLSEYGLGMKGNAAVSLAWTLTGLGMLAVGFMAHVRQLRYVSFVVFAATVGKVLLIDLVDLDPAIRVLILLVLGLVMLAGGYWYIRVQRPPEPTA